MIPTREACLGAVRSRDDRFDGVFFTAVRTTKIYCRPSCPAITPKDVNMTFYPSAAAAQDAGYRACRRCRPDAVPGSPEWDARGDAVARAMRLIADGAVERDGVPGVASRLGYSTRQLQRLTLSELGASPLALARSQRAHTARILIETSDLPLADVAFAAGFGSIRSFNEGVRIAFAKTPSELRAARPRGASGDRQSRAGAPGAHSTPRSADFGPGVPLSALQVPLARIDVRLAYRSPLAAGPLLGHLAATAVPGVEEWRGGAYRRTLRLPHGPGIVALTLGDPGPTTRATTALEPTTRPSGGGFVTASLWLADPRDLTPAIGRCRRLLDLDADPQAIDEALSDDPALAPLIARNPGARIPRTVDADELALRIVLGQQGSTAAAATTTGRLAARLGEAIVDPEAGLTRLFPTADSLAALDPTDTAALPGPRSRAATLHRLATALATGDLDLGPGADRDEARRTLAASKGIGPWTIELIAMRGLGDPDAFPATDLGLARARAELGDPDPDAWRPWRSYAAQYLWATLDHPINRLPQEHS